MWLQVTKEGIVICDYHNKSERGAWRYSAHLCQFEHKHAQTPHSQHVPAKFLFPVQNRLDWFSLPICFISLPLAAFARLAPMSQLQYITASSALKASSPSAHTRQREVSSSNLSNLRLAYCAIASGFFARATSGSNVY